MSAPRSRPVSSRRHRTLDAGAAALAAGAAALTFAAVFFGGASGDGSVLWIGAASVGLAAAGILAAALGLAPVPALDRPGRTALVAFAALVAWAGASVAWSIAADESWSALNKGIAYVGFVGVGVVLAALGTNTTRVTAGLLAGVVGAALVWALAGKAVPALAAGDASRVARLHSPVGYWNGLALLADAALALGVWLAIGCSGRRPVRAAGAALVYVAVLSGLLTSSRAGVLGGLLVVAFWLWRGTRRVESALTLVLAGAPGAAVAAWAFSRHALVDPDQPHSARVHDGWVFALVALAGLALAQVLALRIAPRLVERDERLVGRLLAAGAVAAVAVGLAAVAAVSGNPFTKAAHGLSRGECSNTADRLLCTNNNRLKWWREAADVLTARPLEGAGAGTFEVARKRYRTTGASVTEPHSVPMQVLAGTGIVGGLLLLAFVGGATAAARPPLVGGHDGERLAAVAVAALPLAYALHALVDYDADFLAVTGPTLLATGVLLGAGRPLVRPRGAVVPTLAVVAVAATAITSLALPWLANRRVTASYAASDAGRAARAVSEARSARSLDPLSTEPLYALAQAYQAGGDLRGARAAWTRATELQPENPDTWWQLGLFEFLQTRDMCAAYQALNRSYTLDPKSTHWTPGGELDQARAAVNDQQACG